VIELIVSVLLIAVVWYSVMRGGRPGRRPSAPQEAVRDRYKVGTMPHPERQVLEKDLES
jgi:hypothetical protein